MSPGSRPLAFMSAVTWSSARCLCASSIGRPRTACATAIWLHSLLIVRRLQACLLPRQSLHRYRRLPRPCLPLRIRSTRLRSTIIIRRLIVFRHVRRRRLAVLVQPFLSASLRGPEPVVVPISPSVAHVVPFSRNALRESRVLVVLIDLQRRFPPPPNEVGAQACDAYE